MSNSPHSSTTGKSSIPATRATIRVLIADDHPTIHLGVAALLRAERPDWEICPPARDGREAIALAKELRPDLIIMDYLMPHVRGLDAAEEIHRARTGSEVLMFTGTECRHTLSALFYSKVVRGCLLKKEGTEALLSALDSMLHGHRFRSRGITEVSEEIAAQQGKLGTLTPRERETASLIAGNFSTKEIAAKLGVSNKTIETHRAKLFRKLKLGSAVAVVLWALRVGLVQV